MSQKIKSDRICVTCYGDNIPLQRQRFSQKILQYTQRHNIMDYLTDQPAAQFNDNHITLTWVIQTSA